MCPNNVTYRYAPHKLLAEHPRLFHAKCYKMIKFTVNSMPLCLNCYESITRNTEYASSFQHILLDGPKLTGTLCFICNKSLFTVRSAVNCNDCFGAYMYIATKTRETGHNPHDIRGFLYDIPRQQLIRLFLVEDVDM